MIDWCLMPTFVIFQLYRGIVSHYCTANHHKMSVNIKIYTVDR